MKEKRFAPCNLGRNTICLGKQGEANNLRIEFDCSGWLAEFRDGVVVLYHFPAGKKSADKPYLETVGTDRVWTVSAEDTVYAGDGVIELVMEDAETGAVLKSATGYTNVIYSPSAAQPAIDDGDGGNDNGGGAGTPGEDGGYYKPSVSSSGVLSWQPSKSGMPSVPSSNIKGPQGERGATGATGPQGPAGKDGEPGAQGPAGQAGADGETGPQGPAGTDGVSPTISVTKITGGHRVTITDKNGTKYFDVMDGAAGSGDGSGGGAPGQDGFSPIVSVIAIDGGHRISITDATGTSEFDVMDGEDGAQGPAGPQGEPGATGATGPKGDKGDTGETGPKGENGVGASASVTTITGGHRVTIVSASGTVSFDVMNGADGKDGQDGADGSTAEVIDDTASSTEKTYSSSKIDALLNAQKEAIDDKLNASELPTAINTALAQAKASGEFDGAPGAKGDPGDDYVLTEDDKEEIAEMAAELVEVPGGGSGSNEFTLIEEIDFSKEENKGVQGYDCDVLNCSEIYVIAFCVRMSENTTSDSRFDVNVITTNNQILLTSGGKQNIGKSDKWYRWINCIKTIGNRVFCYESVVANNDALVNWTIRPDPYTINVDGAKIKSVSLWLHTAEANSGTIQIWGR